MLKSLRERYRRLGLGGIVSVGLKNAIEPLRRRFEFDRIHGTETAGVIPLNELDVSGDGEFVFQSTPGWVMREVMKACPIDSGDFVFVDYGSGKGRALLLASHYPFKSVLGVEFSPSLDAIANRNISIYRGRGRRCSDVRSICADAREFPLPRENTLFYIYNPFGPEIMSAILANIGNSLRDNPRKVYVVYYNPVFRSLFDDAGFLELVAFRQFHAFASRRPRGRFAVYASRN